MLPNAVVIPSFRFRPGGHDIHGGQDAFVHGLIAGLVARGVQVDVITHRGRDDPPRALSDGARVHLVETRHSARYSAHELHRGGQWRLMEAMAAYGRAVVPVLDGLRREAGRPLVCLSQDVAEAGWIDAARAAGDTVMTFAHLVFSEFALDGFDLDAFSRLDDEARFGPVVRLLARLVLRRPRSTREFARITRLFKRTHLARLFPDAARCVFDSEEAAFARSNAVLLPSRGMADKVRVTYPRPDADRAYRVAPWAVELDACTPDRVGALRERLGIGARSRVLVTMSRISPDKRLDAVARALLRLERETPALCDDLHWVVCGRPSFFDDEAYLGALRDLVLGLRKVHVHFQGFLRGPERTAHLQLAAREPIAGAPAGLFVQVGRYEAFGLGLVEAMRCGVPVLASDTDGPRELLAGRDGATRGAGLLVHERALEPFDEALARALRRAFEGGAGLRSEAATTLGARYDWSATLVALERALAAVAEAQ